MASSLDDLFLSCPLLAILRRPRRTDGTGTTHRDASTTFWSCPSIPSVQDMALLSSAGEVLATGPCRRQATQVAEWLQSALWERYDLATDMFLLASGRVAVSVAPGLLVRTDGEFIWWTIQGAGRRGRPRLALYRTPHLAAERLARQLAAQPPPDEAPEYRDALPQ